MKKSSSRKNKEWRRRKAKNALIARNRRISPYDTAEMSLTGLERMLMYKWKKGKKEFTIDISELDRKLRL